MTNSVKPVTPSDIEELVGLMAEFYRESGYVLNSELSRQAFGELLEDPRLGQVWLLQGNNQTVGYVVLTIGFSMEYGGRDAFVDDLFVRLNSRRSGIGRYALHTLITECRRRSVRALHLEVGRSNEPAKKLYAEYGFQENDRQLLTLRLERDNHTVTSSARRDPI